MSTVLKEFLNDKEFATIIMKRDYFNNLIHEVLTSIHSKPFIEGTHYNLIDDPNEDIWISMTNEANSEDLKRIATELGYDVNIEDYTMIDPTFVIRYIMKPFEDAYVQGLNEDGDVEIELHIQHIKSYKSGSVASILANYVREKDYALMKMTLDTFSSLMEEILSAVAGKDMKSDVDFSIKAEAYDTLELSLHELEELPMSLIRSVIPTGLNNPEILPTLILQQDLEVEAWVKTVTGDEAVILELPLGIICN